MGNWFALLHTVSWQWLINHHHFSQDFQKLSYCLLQCGLAWVYCCCFHFSEPVTRQTFNCATDFCIFKSTALCETALHYTKQTTINKQILWSVQKKFFQQSKTWHSPSFFRSSSFFSFNCECCFCICLSFRKKKSFSGLSENNDLKLYPTFSSRQALETCTTVIWIDWLCNIQQRKCWQQRRTVDREP